MTSPHGARAGDRDPVRRSVEGRAVPLEGDDIDTDRILPAIFTRQLRFAGLGAHAFAGDRENQRSAGRLHPFDDPRYRDATVLLVGRNFGCGSSREHAVHALLGWGRGIRAIVGESFASIFFANCLANGLPAVTLQAAAAHRAAECAARDPALDFLLDLEAGTLRFGDEIQPIGLPQAARTQLLEGTWDVAAELLRAKERLVATAERLPYWNGWRSGAERERSGG